MKTLQILIVIFLLGLVGNTFAQRPTTLWRDFYDGPTSSVDNFVDMVVDMDGNTYVLCGTKGFISGYDVNITTYKVNTAGQVLWSRTYNGPGNHSLDVPKDIVYDPAGYVIILGELRDSGIVAIKYDLNGGQQWVYQSPAASDVAHTMAVDNSGNIYIAGNSREPQTGNFNALLIKLSTGGTQVFRSFTKYGGTTTKWFSDITKIIHDGYGNMLAVGNCYRSIGTYNSTFVVKFNPGGGESWKYVHLDDSVYVGSYTPADITMDGSGNVYTASFNSQGTNYIYNDALVIKSNLSSGNVNWIKSADPGNTGFDYIKSIRADNIGFVYLSTFSRYLGSNASHVVTKINGTNGDTLWSKEIRSYGQTSNSVYTFNDLLVEDNGNFYISTPDFYNVKKYDTNGDTIWNKTVLGGFSGSVGAYSWMDKYLTTILKGPGNKIFLGCTGTVNSTYDTADVMTSVLTENTSGFISGSRTGLHKLINDNQSTTDTIDLVTDNPAEVISDVNITLDTVLHSNDADLEFYLTHGGVTDTIIYQTGGSGDNFIGTMLDDNAPNNISSGTAPFTGIYKPFSLLSKFNGMNAAGAWILSIYDHTTGNTGTLDAWSISIGFGGATGIRQIENIIPDGFALSQNYPNPFNPSTKIKFDIPANTNGITNLAVYDITGREVAVLVNGKLTPGTYEYEFDATKLTSGVYFYKLQAGDFVETKRMVLVK